MFGKLLVLILSISSHHLVGSVIILDEFETVKSAIQLGADIMAISNSKDAVRIIYDERSVVDIVEKMAESVENIGKDLKRIESQLSADIQKSSRTIIERLRLTYKYDTRLTQLTLLMQAIDNKYKDFKTFWKKEHLNDQVFVNKTIVEFINSVTSVSDAGGLIATVKKLHNMFVPGVASDYTSSLLSLILEDAKQTTEEKCGSDLSTQQEIFKLYEDVKLLETKAFAMMKFAYIQLSLLTKHSYLSASRIIDTDFDVRSLEYHAAFTRAIAQAPLDIRPCDAVSHQRNITYIEMERLYEVAIVSELQRRHYYKNERGDWTYKSYLSAAGSCKGFVPDNVTTNEYLSEGGSRLSREPKMCHGFLYDCKLLADEMEICESSEYNKRYQYVIANGVTYGDTSRNCTGKKSTVSSVTHPLTAYSEDWCVCKCHNWLAATNGLVHIANTDPQVSDVKNNKVITGIKFQRDGEKLVIKIKQAKLGAAGAVSDESEYFGKHKPAFRRTLLSSWMPIGLHNNRFMQMKDHIAPKDHVITGIKFVSHKDGKFGIKIQYTPVNFETGQLGAESHWLDPDVKPGFTRSWNEPNNPMKFSENSVVDSKPDEYIEFTTSSLVGDVGSSVVPFLDAQPVESKPGFPLSGVGLIHKGVIGSGGFFAFRIFTFNFANYIPTPHNSATLNNNVMAGKV